MSGALHGDALRGWPEDIQETRCQPHLRASAEEVISFIDHRWFILTTDGFYRPQINTDFHRLRAVGSDWVDYWLLIIIIDNNLW